MHGAIPPLSQYAFIAWCLVKKKAQGSLKVLYLEDRGIKVFETLVSFHSATRCHNLEDLDFNPHRSEGLKYRILAFI
jgi:hypothetical protein